MNYLDHPELTPLQVQQIINGFDTETTEPYAECERVGKELAEIGWEADFDLHGEITELKPAKSMTVYYSIREDNRAWNCQPQAKIENVSWRCGVFIVKAILGQKKAHGEITEARLCTSFGFNNQGHYIHANQI